MHLAEVVLCLLKMQQHYLTDYSEAWDFCAFKSEMDGAGTCDCFSILILVTRRFPTSSHLRGIVRCSFTLVLLLLPVCTILGGSPMEDLAVGYRGATKASPSCWGPPSLGNPIVRCFPGRCSPSRPLLLRLLRASLFRRKRPVNPPEVDDFVF